MPHYTDLVFVFHDEMKGIWKLGLDIKSNEAQGLLQDSRWATNNVYCSEVHILF